MNDFSNAISPSVSGLRTAVFWNVEDLPFPSDLTPHKTYCRIKDSLSERGYGGGHISIFAYSVNRKFSDDLLAEYSKTRIYFLPQVPEDKCERVQRMLHDMYIWALDADVDNYHTGRVNVIVITNDIQGEYNFRSCLRTMTGRACHTFLLQPDVDIPPEKPKNSLWQGCLLGYGTVGTAPLSLRRADTSLMKRKSRADTDSED